MRFSEICNKEIIGLDNGERMGELRNSDLEIDPGTGEISAIVLPGSSFFGWGKRREDFVIPWKKHRQDRSGYADCLASRACRSPIIDDDCHRTIWRRIGWGRP
ncbi:YlmC/YmxH family sporulation protein [Brevibacillus massiliensis]|uniref:YlmC/YmxH family sporulation protein n=1 Tax=Brevibacillus massiliensis TaxID=1118054 RepID=UPI000319E297|nr:YlmC/YmxH family sporulation protein [Brevibacillus massiliensis]